LVHSFTEDVIYKSKREQGILGSRATPWQETISIIKESPWFGSGFGTDLGQRQPGAGSSLFATAEGTVREHGNSYLALLEYVGLLGITPFLVLLTLVLRQIYRGCALMWRTRDASSYAVPLVLICTACMVHAFFEDWLVAVGSYLNIFFWTSAFLLADLQWARTRQGVVIRPAWNGMPVRLPQVPLSTTR